MIWRNEPGPSCSSHKRRPSLVHLIASDRRRKSMSVVLSFTIPNRCFGFLPCLVREHIESRMTFHHGCCCGTECHFHPIQAIPVDRAPQLIYSSWRVVSSLRGLRSRRFYR